MAKFEFAHTSTFPWDDSLERLQKYAAINLGLTPDNFAKAELEEQIIASRTQEKLQDLKASANLADTHTKTIESLLRSEAKIEDLEAVFRRTEELEEYTSNLLCPWTKAQFLRNLPWLLIGILLVSFAGVALASTRSSTPQPVPTQSK
jgi:hypothetical protein